MQEVTILYKMISFSALVEQSLRENLRVDELKLP